MCLIGTPSDMNSARAADSSRTVVVLYPAPTPGEGGRQSAEFAHTLHDALPLGQPNFSRIAALNSQLSSISRVSRHAELYRHTKSKRKC